jgi:serine/threonine-protein kinase
MSAEETSVRRVGTTLKDKWVLEQLIGVGGMASVYVGRHKIGRVEAIKILHAEVASSPQMRARFEQEAAAVNAFKHPGVVEVRDIDTAEDGSPFLVMELLEGESLADRIRRDPPLELADVLRVASATLDVLQAAHERGIIHRDIKPDNLFLTRDGALKVLDFGIARVRAGGGRKPMTGVGVTLGTMAYMPPEQARGQEIDGRADVYAVGATMFRMLAKRVVHDAASEAERVMKVLGEHAPSLSSVVPTLAPDVALVVDRALAYDRADRYPDAKTMKADVDALARGEAPAHAKSAPPLPEKPPPSSFSFSMPVEADATSRDAPTSVPLARRPAPEAAPPPASSLPTKVGVAPEVAPTRIVDPPAKEPAPPPASSVPTKVSGPDGPSSPAPPQARTVQMPAAPRAQVQAPPPSPVRPAGTPILTPFGQLSAFVQDPKKRSQRTLLIGGIAAAVVLAMITAVVIAVFVVRGSSVDAPSDGPSPLAPTPPLTTKPAK